MGSELSSMQPRRRSEMIDYEILNNHATTSKRRNSQKRPSFIVVGGLVGGPVGQITTWKPRPSSSKTD